MSRSPGRPQKSPERDGRSPPAEDHPRRHGRLLRIRRAAGQSGAPRQAGRRRRIPRARRRGGRKLRSPQVRRPVGDAVGDGQAAMPGPDLREAALRGLQGRLAADPRDLRRAHADHRAAVARRGLSRRHGKPAGHSAGARRRARDPREDQGGDRPQRFRRHLLQQVSGEARLRPPQAERPVRHHAGDGAGVRRSPAGRQIPRHRAGDQRQDELARPLHRPRHAQPVARIHAGQFRQGRRVLLLDLERRRQPRGPRQPDPEVGRRREHVLQRSHRIRRHGRRIAAADRQGLAALRGQGHRGAGR